MKKSNIVLCLAVVGLLTACDQFKSGLGLDHYQPDEFSIPTNPPLELPPNYKLRPPRTTDGKGVSAAHVKDQNPADKAQEAIGVKKKDTTQKATKPVSEQKNEDASIVKKAQASSEEASRKADEKQD
jgi:hypothetical protein